MTATALPSGPAPGGDGSPTPYLRTVNLERFRGVHNIRLEGLGPGFNLVYGPNEVGKSTIAAGIAGVLFGWDDPRRPLNEARETRDRQSGSLVFRTVDEEGEPATFEIARRGSHDREPEYAAVLDDIDESTFRTLFLLTGDELRGLHSSTELLARLLNLQVGTKTPPAKALASLRARIDRICADEGPESLPALVRERVRLRETLQEAGQRRRELMAAWEESRALQAEQADLEAQAAATNELVESLERGSATVQTLDRDRRELGAALEEQRGAKTRARKAIEELTAEVGPRLAALRERDERSLRQRLTELEDETLRLEASEAMAERQLNQSQAALTLASQGPDEEAAETASAPAAMASGSDRQPVSRSMSVGVCAGICTLLAVIGVPLFLYGRGLGSLSISVLGIGLVIFAVLMAAMTLVLAFRPGPEATTSGEDGSAARLRDAQWIVRQDEERLEAIRRRRQALDERIAAEIASMGLDEAAGSLRQARQRLDDARAVRAEIAQEAQREQAAIARAAEVEQELATVNARRRKLLDGLGLRTDATSDLIAEELERRRHQHRALRGSADHLAARRESIDERLAGAMDKRGFDELKLAHQVLKTQIADTSERLSRLLLAQRQLEAAITTWGSRNQPGVYAQASVYLAAITLGRWTSIAMRADGRLLVRDDEGVECDPAELSLGAVQQLYLAMRLALLHEARSVGLAMPVLADDILVNFDGARQAEAMAILGQVAASRQVIFFTCHDQTRELAKKVLESASCELRCLTM